VEGRWLLCRKLLDNRKHIGIYPLKQFAHVIHGNPNPQGRIEMGSPSPNGICSSGKKRFCKIKILSIVNEFGKHHSQLINFSSLFFQSLLIFLEQIYKILYKRIHENN